MLTFPLPHADKLNRIFAHYHDRTEPELSNQAMATFLGQRMGRVIAPEAIARARAGDETLPDDVCEHLCALVGVSSVYLVGSRQGEDRGIDQLLRLWTAGRDRGLKHIAVRAGYRDPAVVDLLITEIEAMPLATEK